LNIKKYKKINLLNILYYRTIKRSLLHFWKNIDSPPHDAYHSITLNVIRNLFFANKPRRRKFASKTSFSLFFRQVNMEGAAAKISYELTKSKQIHQIYQ